MAVSQRLEPIKELLENHYRRELKKPTGEVTTLEDRSDYIKVKFDHGNHVNLSPFQAMAIIISEQERKFEKMIRRSKGGLSGNTGPG